MLSRERLEELRHETKASDVDIPPWAVAWTEAEAKAFFESGGLEVPQLDAPPDASAAAAQALTSALEKLSLEYSQEPIIKGQFNKGQLIGQGGTALVYLATHPESGRRFALKQLHKTKVARFGSLGTQLAFREKEAYDAIKPHPFIVRCYDTFQDERSLYEVLELCVFDLFQLVEEEGGKYGEISEEWTRFYTASVALALRHIHRSGFVYRDLKLENIMVATSGHLKLTDLGSAKRVDKSRTFTAIGTEEYIPPEVLRGHGRNAASDWWGLGILVHELLMGRPPFEGQGGARDREGVMDDIHAFAKQGGGARESLRASILAAGGAPFEAVADFVVCLLDERESHRLGCAQGGFPTLQEHRWFSGFDWLKLLAMELAPPYIPRCIDNADISGEVEAHELEPPPVEDDLKPEFAAFGPYVEVGPDGCSFTLV